MRNTSVYQPAVGVAGRAGESIPGRQSLKETLRLVGSRLLPHDTRNTTCPPAPLVPGAGPPIIVTSIMRSGTHLMLDSIFNNFPSLRRLPLFVDLDAYARAGLPPGPVAAVTGVIIKTHHPQVPLPPDYAAALMAVASRAVVLSPRRPAAEVRRSLAKWDMNYTPSEFAEMERRFEQTWAPYSPITFSFSGLLTPGGVEFVLAELAQRTGTARRRGHGPVMPAPHRFGVYVDKGLTRFFGRKAPRINTTIGYRLSARASA